MILTLGKFELMKFSLGLQYGKENAIVECKSSVEKQSTCFGIRNKEQDTTVSDMTFILISRNNAYKCTYWQECKGDTVVESKSSVYI